MRRPIALLATCVLCLALSACGDDEQSGPLTIMPIGDSWTDGVDGSHTYRCYLDQMLTDAGVQFDFVGSRSTPAAGDSYGCPVEFDQDHESKFAASIGGIRDRALDSVEQLQPDVALVLLGAGELAAAEPPDAAADELAAFVADLQAVSPDIDVLVAQLIPIDYDGPVDDSTRSLMSQHSAALNDEIASFARLSTDDSLVAAVDMSSEFPVDHLLPDGLHPNEKGDELMATRWMIALQDVGALD